MVVLSATVKVRAVETDRGLELVWIATMKSELTVDSQETVQYEMVFGNLYVIN